MTNFFLSQSLFLLRSAREAFLQSSFAFLGIVTGGKKSIFDWHLPEHNFCLTTVQIKIQEHLICIYFLSKPLRHWCLFRWNLFLSLVLKKLRLLNKLFQESVEHRSALLLNSTNLQRYSQSEPSHTFICFKKKVYCSFWSTAKPKGTEFHFFFPRRFVTLGTSFFPGTSRLACTAPLYKNTYYDGLTQHNSFRPTAVKPRAGLKNSVFFTQALNTSAQSNLSERNSDNATEKSRILVITSGKGGVGKTTATANLGMSIARLGYRVALIDADIGLRNLDLLLGLENRVLYTAMDILEGQCRLDQALIRDKRWKNLSLLAISKNRQRYNVTRKNMENLVNSIIALGYQFVLIDCPAGIDVGFINAISPAHEAIIVTTPEITAIRDADRVAGLLEANGLYNVKLLVNRVRPDMIQQNDMMSVKDVQEMLGIPLLGAIPEDTHVIISTNRGEPLVLKKKLTLSGIAFENAARRLIGKQDYFLDLTTPYKGVFQKVQEFFLGAAE